MSFHKCEHLCYCNRHMRQCMFQPPIIGQSSFTSTATSHFLLLFPPSKPSFSPRPHFPFSPDMSDQSELSHLQELGKLSDHNKVSGNERLCSNEIENPLSVQFPEVHCARRSGWSSWPGMPNALHHVVAAASPPTCPLSPCSTIPSLQQNARVSLTRAPWSRCQLSGPQ